jgi:hypothetical protein
MSFLKLNRLVVSKDGKNAYSQNFHEGLNIIRGHNSTGKSTISNFIFFALGGEFVDWLPEAASCNYVIAEIEINGAVITVKRDIENIQRRPMAIYFGDMEKAMSSNVAGWHIYPYSKTDKTESFSQIIFKALEFPEISTENQESITVNQILRLLYVDQLSSLDSLMRNEDFDSPLIRSAIGNLLLGTYNDNLLSLQIQLRQKERDYNDIKKQVKALEDVFDNSPFDFDRESIQNNINEKRKQLANVLEALKKPETIISSIKQSDTKNEIKSLQANLSKYKSRYDVSLNEISKAKANIIDNNEFIGVLNSKLVAIDESLSSREVLGRFPIQYCPVCLEKIEENVEDNHCKLCKKEIKDDIGKTKLLRMKLEVEMQIKESTSILKEKEKLLDQYLLSIQETERELRNAQNAYDIFISQTRSSVENKFDKLLEQKGKLIADIDFLEKQLQLVASYGEYKSQTFALKSAIDRLTDAIDRQLELQRKKATTAYSTIQKYALKLLKGDGAYEEKFQDGRKVTINFGKNTFYLDDRNRFSASSLVLLKNCVRFAIFFASVELDYFRYPRFILCDNVEDKGMEEARSKNFQKNIADIANSSDFKDKHFQIIMTTSMISDDLNVENYTIGDFYDGKAKSLKL